LYITNDDDEEAIVSLHPNSLKSKKKWFQKADNYATLPLQRTLLLLPSLLNAKHDTDEEELLNQTFF